MTAIISFSEETSREIAALSIKSIGYTAESIAA